MDTHIHIVLRGATPPAAELADALAEALRRWSDAEGVRLEIAVEPPTSDT